MSAQFVPHFALAILCVLVSHLSVGAQTSTIDKDPRIGTWILNLEKSRFTAGNGPKMQVRRVTSRPDGFIVFTQIGLDAQDNPTFIQTTYMLDGKEYPEYTQSTLAEYAATGAKPNTNTYVLTDPYTVKITRFDVMGKITGTSTQAMSQDGRTLTVTSGIGTQVWNKQ
jgi:hypothetical protein